MKYVAEEETKALLNKYAAYGQQIRSFIDSLTNSIEQIFHACEKFTFQDVQSILSSFKNRTSDQLMLELEDRLSLLELQDIASAIKDSLNNIKMLQESPIGPAVARGEARVIVMEHISDIITRLQQEKRQFAEILYNKFAEDAQKTQRGELVDPKNSQSYKFLQDSVH